MSVHDGHRGRLKERYVKEGGKAFAAHNLLELLLFYAIPRRDTNVTAHKLLKRFGTVDAVLTASVEELCEVDGISENSATLIRLAGELGQRFCRDKTLDAVRFYSYDDIGRFLTNQFLTASHERVVALYLDAVGRLKKLSVICEGNVNSVKFDVRDIAAAAMAIDACAVVVAHNHPGGSPLPSSDDLDTTKNLKNVLSIAGIELIDHYIIAEDGYCRIISECLSNEEKSQGVKQGFAFKETTEYFNPNGQ